ncbi:outer membrane lipid asymmetry maintenance protein MlaD [Salidesulfovibrio brasiliensis]|uniref:outer membrane lipid asymmetry maintenance protein MlaD n=1 Tax=Salidesulfovibrio brasiliensis TaxID=221711 RepID=UPI0006D18CD5|nr:outer membrane lipid asymmetry maintenance protein MlaD [Salidesulfovibrio brasiliensis]
MKKYSKETAVGIFVFVGLLAMAYMSVKLGNVGLFTDSHWSVEASFTDVSGLKANAPVQMYGVKIGYVNDIVLNQKDGVADVNMKIRKGVVISDDAIASVKTSGLIGDKFIKITPGLGSPLEEDGFIFDTEPALDLEDLISKFAFGKV